MIDPTDRLVERVLVLRCQTGDEAAFEELVRRYSPRLRFYLRKMLGDVHQADDALQDVLWDAYRGLPKLSDAGAFPCWVYRIARDRAYRELRRRRPPECAIDEMELVETAENDGEFKSEDAEQIHAALDTLAAEHREALMLRFIEDMTYDEIARATGCAVGTVRSRIHYAKRALRRAIERTSES